MMQRLCVLCGAGSPRGRSSVCNGCHARMAARGERWCPQCRQAVPRAEYGATSICRACNAHQAARRAAGRAARQAARPRCVLCQAAPPDTSTSSVCRDCRQALVTRGERWCQRGLHVVHQTDCSPRAPACRACLRAAATARLPVCQTCAQPLDGHARCGGCTRLLHGTAAQQPLCWLCARDRANGVPPHGRPWRELEAIQ